MNGTENDIFLIIEKYHPKDNSFLFDFADHQSYNDFVALVRPNEPVSIGDPSMLEISNFKNKKRFRDGTYYKLNKKWIVENNITVTAANNSAVIRYRIDLHQASITEFFKGTGKPPGTNKIDGFPANKIAEVLDQCLIDKEAAPFDNLTIRLVGQGSWNEFIFKQSPRLIFDIGTIYTAPKDEVAGYIKTREKDYQASRPVLILSHWDIDHYHMLLEAEDDTIRAFQKFIFRNNLPNKTSYRVYQRFLDLNEAALLPVDPETPAKKRWSKKLKMIPTGSYLKLYNGSRHWDRNLSGIMLSFQSHKIAAICAADFEYSQLQSDVLNYFHYRHDHYLIVPHHGGKAGKVKYEPISAIKKDAIVSAGEGNPYGHPFKSVTEELFRIRFHIVLLHYRKAHYELALR